MKRGVITTIIAVAIFATTSCSHQKSESQTDIDIRNSSLTNESDSLAYIIGMSIGEQLINMDSSINITLVSRAIVEQFERRAEMSLDEAKTQYLRYLLYVEPERKRGYEDRYLSDLAESDRKYTKTRSGITYNIEVIGDESITAKGNNDWVTINYSISRVNGERLLPNAESESSFETLTGGVSDLMSGVQESVKMIGKGGRIEAWVPSKLAYGEGGDEEIGVEPIETLMYIIEVVDVEKNMAQTRKKEIKEQLERERKEQLEQEQQNQ